MSIQHDHTLNPVTGLAFCSSSSGKLLVFAGEGSFLKVFEAERLELVFQCEVFQEQVIHGITINESLCHAHDLKVVIWGGKSILLLTENKLDDFLSYGVASLAGNAKLVSDWILDAAISPQNDGSCVLVTAHNTVIRAKVGQNGEVPLLEELPSPSKSILYSAHVVWDTPSCVLVAAGTVFGEIIVWRSTSSENGAFSVCGTEILFTFTGHEGSIFGVNISPPIEHPGMFGARLLASCSDDRTIRVWDLSKASNTTQQCKDVVLLRETGFGENNELASTQSSVERCVATVMGHASRIWRVKFLVETSSVLGLSFLSILSFGEDATTQQWALNFDSESATPELETVSKSMDTEVFTPLKAKLTQTDIYAFHSGKHIWSTALWISGHKLHNVATGGADGKISIYSANIANKSGYNAFRVWDLDEVFKDFCPSNPDTESLVDYTQDVMRDEAIRAPRVDTRPKNRKIKKAPQDTFNRYAFVSENQFLATTTFGRILECNLDGTPRWTEISLPESGKMDLKSYAVVKGFPEVGLAFLAGANGKIYARQNDKPVIEVGIVEGKVADMFGIFYQPTGSFQILATTLATNVAISFLIKLTSLDGAQLFTRCSYKLLDKFVVTSAGCCNHLLVLGSRNGSLAIYNPLDKETPMCSWKDPDSGSGDAITTILALCSNSGSNSAKFYFLTTRRNGLYSIFSCMITRNTDGSIKTADILPVHHGSPPFGPMIESAWFQGSDLVLYGFRGKNFVVWNETKQYEVMNVECGGAHRSYAYSPLNIVEGGGHFLYTKASKFYTHSQTKPSHQIAKQGGHGREIKVCAVSPDYEFIATGAEDTSIRIWRYEDVGTTFGHDFSCSAVIQKHTAGIQHLQWYGRNYLFSSGGNEEFFVWAVEEIPRFGIGIVCEATCPDQSEERDLRIMSFDVTATPIHKTTSEQRSILISFAYSDSTTRMYKYSKKKGFELLATGKYTSSCLTQISHIHVHDSTVYILTAATDGNITLWNCDTDQGNAGNAANQELAFLSTINVHQNAVKSLDFRVTTSRNHILVATGGDDNALGLSIYSVKSLSSQPHTYVLRSGHTAAITGLCILPSSSSDPGREAFHIVSSSNDQRVKEWVIELSSPQGKGDQSELVLEIKKTGDTFTSIADVGDVAALRDGAGPRSGQKKVLVVGNGMEVWSVSL